MANALYTNAKQMILKGQFNWETAVVRALLVARNQYEPDFAQHGMLNDIPQAAVVATSQPLANKAVSGGACLADSVLFQEVAGPEIGAIVLYVDSGDPATSPLLAHIDTGYANLPCTPNGGDIRILWPPAPNGIFHL